MIAGLVHRHLDPNGLELVVNKLLANDSNSRSTVRENVTNDEGDVLRGGGPLALQSHDPSESSLIHMFWDINAAHSKVLILNNNARRRVRNIHDVVIQPKHFFHLSVHHLGDLHSQHVGASFTKGHFESDSFSVISKGPVDNGRSPHPVGLQIADDEGDFPGSVVPNSLERDDDSQLAVTDLLGDIDPTENKSILLLETREGKPRRLNCAGNILRLKERQADASIFLYRAD
mmetsp:Transcript_24121/g.78496  ORF Transcript_24121/g.78496 Transcript_24121/m.78496 type:complete len:231 (-) Transcript_24121:2359-3051(-)